MSRFWSPVVGTLSPYVPGEQPKLQNLVKLNTNERGVARFETPKLQPCATGAIASGEGRGGGIDFRSGVWMGVIRSSGSH